VRRFLVCVACACHGAPSIQPDAGGGDDAPGGTHLIAATRPVWLHQTMRLVFDQPIDPAGASATLAGAPIGVTAVPVDPQTLDVTIDPAARGSGELAVHVAGVDVIATLEPWAIAAGPPADASPAIAVGDDGTVLAAWHDRGAASVAAIAGQTWQRLGDPFPADGTPALALAASGPIVAWLAGGVAHVARWTGGDWRELPSPGSGRALALAASDGKLVVALSGATLAVRAFASNGWQATGDLPAIAGEPLLALGDHVALAWIDGDALHAARLDGGVWTPLAPIAAPGIAHASLAARDNMLAIAWDQRAGSFAVLAAEALGGAAEWTRLGHALDVDVAGDAIAPTVALDSTLHPLVAWTELVETAQRGVLARWSGAAWTIAAGATWLPDPALAPTRAALALHPGDAPVVAASAGGSLVVARFDGPARPVLRRASIAGCGLDAAAPPARLSLTGCFENGEPHPGLVPYDVVVELWTDGAKKRRWIGLPDGATASISPTGAWDVPAGTLVMKEFALETAPGNPATRRPIETRVLVKDPALGWRGFSYRWRADASDADLEADAEDTVAWPMIDGTTHAHSYPSRSDCATCHDESYGPLLGLRAPELARWFDYDGVIADQPETLVALGVAPIGTAPPFASPHDPSQSWQARARGYMAANCAHCHNPEHVWVHDLRYATPLASTNLCPDIVVGDPAGSTVYQLVSTRPGMPPLGTLAADPLAVQILGNWITEMTSCP
jgi:hypothetical protein